MTNPGENRNSSRIKLKVDLNISILCPPKTGPEAGVALGMMVLGGRRV